MFERAVSVADVSRIARSGEVIAHYPDDRPYPSRLCLGRTADGPLHVLAADDMEGDRCIVVTVYRPDPALWQPDFRRRRNP
jgi:hypothetical protein